MNDQLRLLAYAANYDLRDGEERLRSHKDLIAFFHALNRASPPHCFVEIGAYAAEFSREMRKQHPAAQVIAYEANPENHAKFMAEHDFPALNISYRNIAVSDNAGMVDFYIQKSLDGKPIDPVRTNNSTRMRLYDGFKYDKVSVQSVNLGQVLSTNESVGRDFTLWIDVEGATEPVLKGTKEALDRVKFIFTEVEDVAYWDGQWLMSDVTKYLTDNGFVLIARDFETPHQYNLVFIRKDLLNHYLVQNAIALYYSACAHPASYSAITTAASVPIAASSVSASGSSA